MQTIKVDLLDRDQKSAIVKLWNAEYPQHLSYSSIEGFDEYLKKLGDPTHYLALNDDLYVVGWLGVFSREGERWMVLIIEMAQQRKGLGSALLKQAMQNENELNGWVIDHDRDIKPNGEKYLSPLPFYQRNGFHVLSKIRLELGNLSAVKVKWVSNTAQIE